MPTNTLLNNKNKQRMLIARRNMPQQKLAHLHKQNGSALLLTVLVIFITLTLLTLTATNSSVTSIKLTTNKMDSNRALLAADSAFRYAWNEENKNFDLTSYIQNSSKSGYYDLRNSANIYTGLSTVNSSNNIQALSKEGDATNSSSTGTLKTLDNWKELYNQSSSAWGNTSRYAAMPNKLALDSSLTFVSNTNNPMQLNSTPLFTKGIHDPVVRSGTEGFNCLPMSILGLSKGAQQQTTALIEVRVIPRAGCFRNLIH